MKKSTISSRIRVFSLATLIAAISLQSLINVPGASAGQIGDRKLELQANGTTGGSTPGGIVNHLFTFELPTAASIGSIKFEYCTTAADVGGATCIAPTGMDASGAVLSSTSGQVGGMSMRTDNRTANSYVLTREPGATIALTGGETATYQIGTVKNPMPLKVDGVTPEPNYTFFVRISTYASFDGQGAAIDTGTVTASTSEQIVLSGIMPESLVFCTGETIPLGAGSVPDCANATPGLISFNQLFSPTDTATAKSEMAASTNAGSGYVISVNGPTLTSNSNTITAMGDPGSSTKGVSQFGLNLKANTTLTSAAAVGAEVTPAANPVLNLRGRAVPASGYDVVDTFRYVSGSNVADSGDGGLGGTDAQIYTVSYIANVPGSQPAGTYNTTLTYICTPTF